MKKSDLRNIIKEEIQKVLTENENYTTVYAIIPHDNDWGIHEDDVMIFRNEKDAEDYANSLDFYEFPIKTKLK